VTAHADTGLSPSVRAGGRSAAPPCAVRPDAELIARVPLATLAFAHLGARMRALLLRSTLRLEGGEFRSRTARELMRRCHGVDVGAYSYGECFVAGAFPPGTVIGRYVSIAEGVRALGRNHPTGRLAMHPYFYNERLGQVGGDTIAFQGLDVGHDAWLGLRAIVTPGCRRIGLGAVVGAGAVVTHDVPDFAIVAGTPARVLRYRFPEHVRDAIRASRWWERPPAELARHPDILGRDVSDALLVHPLFAPAGPAARGRP
jgi:acetyltransferase-like isoleucine patch superfamily enzyme